MAEKIKWQSKISLFTSARNITTTLQTCQELQVLDIHHQLRGDQADPPPHPLERMLSSPTRRKPGVTLLSLSDQAQPHHRTRSLLDRHICSFTCQSRSGHHYNFSSLTALYLPSHPNSSIWAPAKSSDAYKPFHWRDLHCRPSATAQMSCAGTRTLGKSCLAIRETIRCDPHTEDLIIQNGFQ